MVIVMHMDSKIKKNILYSVIFLCLVGLIIGLFAYPKQFHPTKPTNHNESIYGIYKIKIIGWDDAQGQIFTQWARETLPELNRLGPTFQIVESNEDIYILRSNMVDDINQCGTNSAIVYQFDAIRNKKRIVIDPTCIRGELQFKTAFMHEIGHSLGMYHVCRANEQRSDCSTVGRGLAIMNPLLIHNSNILPEDNLSTENFAILHTWELQELDFKEFCKHRNCVRN